MKTYRLPWVIPGLDYTNESSLSTGVFLWVSARRKDYGDLSDCLGHALLVVSSLHADAVDAVALLGLGRGSKLRGHFLVCGVRYGNTVTRYPLFVF